MGERESLWTTRDRRRDAEHGAFSPGRWRATRNAPGPPSAPPPAPDDGDSDGTGGSAPGRRGLALGGGALAVALVALAIALVSPGSDDALDAEPAPLVTSGGGGTGQTDVGRVYAAASPGVVSVQVSDGGSTASGTGFVVSADGTIVTNSHVVGEADTAQVQFGDSGRQVQAEVLGTDPSSDLAALRVDPDEVGTLHPLTLAESDRVQVGDQVVAIGHPFGLERTATAGIVSGVGREIQAPNGFAIDEVIQTDAPINPGNSGGPLLDARGRVIGVNSQIATAGNQGNVGIGFAVPADTVRDVLPSLSRGQTVERSYLGLSSSAAPGADGATVERANPGGPAAEAGIRSGDVVVSVDGEPVREPDDVAQAIEDREPGEEVELELIRDGERRTVTVELGTRPERVP
jgi:putative serine protease PepD